jgi:acetyltransferase-like isoleucine patch superfamily enzyme/dTDP-4-dehydrorhamnose 3,5-epimerase-like enzyme
MAYFVHPQGICETTSVGAGTRIWAFAHVLPGAVIGRDCNICDHVFIENDVRIGDRVTVKCGVQLWDGLRVADDVFIGPNATFTNDRFPRSKVYQERVLQTEIEHHSSIGAGAVVLPGLRVGAYSMVGAGAVVTHDVPPYAVLAGNPARIIGYAETTSRPVATVTDPSLTPAHPIEELSVPGVQLYRFPQFDDLRGNLTVTDMENLLPFAPKRYFLVYAVSNQRIRGEHAHKVCKQFLVCVSGSIHVVVDNGKEREEIVLCQPNLGLYVPPMTWATFYKFTGDAVLLVFASHQYDPDDYVRGYQEFLKRSTEHSG